ncbi:GNAT family N-acetyltransferase [Pseudomonas sp. F1_0610]|uniref:GNAT family N-acetyltransferase n=1 Tax=Pseudomonas sp. F1_0610 TaxID=3114284 RepID=UPI0039C1A265
MQIIQATCDHLDLLVPMFVRYRELYGARPMVELSRAFLEQRIRSQEAVVYLAFTKDSNELIGFSLLYTSYSSLSLRPVWILNDIFVIESARRKQVARSLVIRSRDDATAANAVRLRVATNTHNNAIRKMYESLGFYENPQLTNYILPLD